MVIPYGRQDIQESDINEVVSVLKSEFLTQGPKVPEFENKISSLIGNLYSIATNSATSALHIACLALELKAGDTLWTSPITFVASANVALQCGANVDFVDIKKDTFNMCPDALAAKLEKAEYSGTLPKIVMPVALCGQSCEMEKIKLLAEKYGFKIIEDASHAIGGRYRGAYIGNGNFADISVFSFHPVKIVTTGEGGVATTNNIELANRMRLLRSHGVTRELSQMDCASHGPWYYQQIAMGFNYRMTDLQAALGSSQLDRLNEYVTKRTELANLYNERLKNSDLMLPVQHEDTQSSWHLYVIQVPKHRDHLPLFKKLIAKGIGVNLHYIPVHTHPFYKSLGFKLGTFPCAEDYYSRSISIPLYPTMKECDQFRVIDVLLEYFA